MAKIRTLTSIEQIKAATSISDKIKDLLDKCPTQDERPVAFAQWARKVFAQGRSDGNTDSEISNWVQVYGYKCNYSSRQIYRVLNDNGVTVYNKTKTSSSSGIDAASIRLPLDSFKKIAMGLSGMDESEIMQADYSPQRIKRASEGSIRQWTARMDDADLREFPRWIRIVVAQFEEALELMEQKKVSRVKYGV